MNQPALWSFEGRASRSKFWLVFLLSIFVSIVVLLFTLLATPALILMGAFSPVVASVVSILLNVLLIPIWIISIATTVRRFHDRNKSGWWYLIALVPIIGFFWIFIECGFLKGTIGANNFGEEEGGSAGGTGTMGTVSTLSTGGTSPTKLIISILLVIILVALVGRAIWAYQAVRNDALIANISLDIGGGTENPAKFSVNGVETATITGTSFSVPNIESTTVKPTTNQVKSEIDKYDVELYTLRQGVTSVSKIIDGINRTITYTRSMNSIERKVNFSRPDGSSNTLTATIDLDAKDKLPAAINEMEDEFARDCKNASTKECSASKMTLDYIKANCVAIQTNEEVSACMIAGVMSAWANQNQ